MIRNILVIVLYRSAVAGFLFISVYLMASSSIASSSEALDFSIPERLYGRFAMIAFDLMIVSYLITGQIIPGVFWRRHKLKDNYYVIFSLKQKTISKKQWKTTLKCKTEGGQWLASLLLLEPTRSLAKLFLVFFKAMEMNPFKPLKQFVQGIYKRSN